MIQGAALRTLVLLAFQCHAREAGGTEILVKVEERLRANVQLPNVIRMLAKLAEP